jgi:hypothetical protein
LLLNHILGELMVMAVVSVAIPLTVLTGGGRIDIGWDEIASVLGIISVLTDWISVLINRVSVWIVAVRTRHWMIWIVRVLGPVVVPTAVHPLLGWKETVGTVGSYATVIIARVSVKLLIDTPHFVIYLPSFLWCQITTVLIQITLLLSLDLGIAILEPGRLVSIYHAGVGRLLNLISLIGSPLLLGRLRICIGNGTTERQ